MSEKDEKTKTDVVLPRLEEPWLYTVGLEENGKIRIGLDREHGQMRHSLFVGLACGPKPSDSGAILVLAEDEFTASRKIREIARANALTLEKTAGGSDVLPVTFGG